MKNMTTTNEKTNEKKIVSLKQYVPICPNKDDEFNPNAFTDEERAEMCRTGYFACPFCKRFSHKAMSGKVWNVHWGKWIQS